MRAWVHDLSRLDSDGAGRTCASRPVAKLRIARNRKSGATADISARAIGVLGAMFDAAIADDAPLARRAASRSPVGIAAVTIVEPSGSVSVCGSSPYFA